MNHLHSQPCVHWMHFVDNLPLLRGKPYGWKSNFITTAFVTMLTQLSLIIACGVKL
jgi:hypothetical protein